MIQSTTLVRLAFFLKKSFARWFLCLLTLLAVSLINLQLTSTLPLSRQFSLLLGATVEDFDGIEFWLSSMPRLTVGLLVGASLGISGSLLQQVTRNRLISPMTIGSSSGAWLGLVITTLWFPSLNASYGHYAALFGALMSAGLVLMIVGRNGVSGLPIVLAGMAVTILLGAVATALILLKSKYAPTLFVWGAGDIGQVDWRWVTWLWPKLSFGLLFTFFLPRAIDLLKLGSETANGRGLSYWPAMLAVVLVSAWFTAVSITPVGLIGFIGLLGPSLAVMAGARTTSDQLLFSALLGGILLIFADSVALLLSGWTQNLVPTGAASALLGAPALIWICRRKWAANRSLTEIALTGTPPDNRKEQLIFALSLSLFLFICFFLSQGIHGWRVGWPDDSIWRLRWPRMLTATASGVGLAIAGIILQRLLRNPLASPDILGLSAGSTIAVIITITLYGGSLSNNSTPLAAFIGSMIVMLSLWLLGRRSGFPPHNMALIGISLGALLNGALQVFLAKGTPDAFAILGWLSGSTYRATGTTAILLSIGIIFVGILTILMTRALTLLSIAEGVASAQGLNVTTARLLLLVLASLMCAFVTSLLGPISFVGLLAPHMSSVLGAHKLKPQLLLASLIGAIFMLFSDWLGRNIIFPDQVPAGIFASIICGAYFLYLLMKRRAN